jgi:hypothetical protein
VEFVRNRRIDDLFHVAPPPLGTTRDGEKLGVDRRVCASERRQQIVSHAVP